MIEGADIVGGTYIINWAGSALCLVNGVAKTKGAAITLAANTNATVKFTGGTFSDVQLELGSVPTAFERVSYAAELSRCQRYFYAPGIAYSTFGYAQGAGSVVSTQMFFPTTMRATPSVSAYLTGGVNTSGGGAALLGANGASFDLIAASAGSFGAVVNWASFNAELTA